MNSLKKLALPLAVFTLVIAGMAVTAPEADAARYYVSRTVVCHPPVHTVHTVPAVPVVDLITPTIPVYTTPTVIRTACPVYRTPVYVTPTVIRCFR
ncbi:MAG: hypothetical protein DWQ42_09185 [Planctomycetota bacterium]|nr:MAG: hypothetical protein DWQ42_09185 [Planctomycetota bacterium]REK37934.1 MAG: hypothetical protein DWQ46_21365 [Planctomycetota bacterium]